MAIEKSNFKVSRFESEFSIRSRDTMYSDEEEIQPRSSAVKSDDDDDEFGDADSGAGSDDFDLLDLGEIGAEFCQIGNQTCRIPLDLYDLPGLEGILSVDVWNELLSEEERLCLAKYLPDMDHETFVVTLKELFTGFNFHFGSPIKKMFDMLKGGLCEPRVSLYREGLSFFQKRQHYHLLQKHQNDMVTNLCQLRDAWLNCRGYSIEEKLRVLNIMRSQKNLMYEKMDNLGSDSSEKVSGEALWSSKIKDKKAALKMVRRSMQEYEFYPREDSAVMEPDKYGKQKPKSILKLTGSKPHSEKNMTRDWPSPHQGLDMNSRVNGSMPNKAGVYDKGEWLKSRDQIKMGKDIEEPIYGMKFQQDRDISHVNLMDRSGGFRRGKRQGHLRLDEIAPDSSLGVPQMLGADFHGYVRDSDLSHDVKMSTSRPSGKVLYDYQRKVKYPENVQQYLTREKVNSVKSRGAHLPMRGDIVDSSSHGEPFWHNQSRGDDFSRDSTFKSDEWTLKSKKWKSGRESPDLCYKNYRSSSPQVTERYLHSDFRTKSSQKVSRGAYVHSGEADMVALKGNQVLHRGEDTESDSSEHLDDDEDSNSFLRSKSAHSHKMTGGSCHSKSKSHPDHNKDISIKRKRKEFDYLGEIDIKKMGGFEEQSRLVGSKKNQPNAKKKGKVQIESSLCNPARAVEDGYLLDNLDNYDGTNQIYKFGKQRRTRGESLDMLYEGKRKSRTGRDHPNPRSHYLSNYDDEEEDDLLAPKLLEGIGVVHDRFLNEVDEYDSPMHDRLERFEASLLGCNSVSRKRKGKEDENAILQSNFSIKLDDSSSMKRKGKKKKEPDTVSLGREGSEFPSAEIRTTDIDLDKKQKKSFACITPTVHTGFSFSIVHLLSAVRLAMIMPLPADPSNIGIPKDSQGKVLKEDASGVHSDDKVDSSDGHTVGGDIPFLPIQEIVNRVRSNPVDPCILQTQEPLQDLVRGVMKIFSSRSAPLGAKGWKVLAVYEKSTKSWSWVGPVVDYHSDHATPEGIISPEAWGLPYKMLVKLVDAFANWLKSGQDTLQQIGSLPSPPLDLMQVNLDEKERFKDLRAQKSLNTISRSSEEVRAYFRKEEILRYSIPDRAFSYTAADGKKSIVAPLRRCGGKPTSKARDHFMLKRDRPPHVTVLCLVRDAAARLPGSIGTRADVCTLIRDSQYIVEDVSDVQINQVVSGALDRLHYERDPCVQYDGERKLWVYLHRDREEEDFEDDGTSSTKKWKRQKKDTADHSDQGAVAVAYDERRDQSCPDVCSDLNVEPSSIEDDNTPVEPANHVKLNMEDNIDEIHGSEEVDEGHGSTIWDSLGQETTQKDKLLCQENSANEEFDDESFGRDGPVNLLNGTFLS